jgi:hypothetical protein
MAVTGDYQFDIDGYTFGLGTTTSLTEVSGLDMPEINLTANARGYAHGESVSASFFKGRIVAMQGRVNGTLSTLPTLKYALQRAFRPREDFVRLTFRLPGFANQFVLCKPQNLRGPFGSVDTAVGLWDFQGTLYCADPRIYSEASKTSATLSPGTGGVVSTTANNAGNFDAPTTITFVGPLTDPVITNTTTGKAFGLSGTLTLGQTFVVSSLEETVYEGATSRYSRISATNRSFIELAPGNNALSVSGGTGSNGTIVVTWRDVWA